MIEIRSARKCITVANGSVQNVLQLKHRCPIFDKSRFKRGRNLATIAADCLLLDPAMYNLPLVPDDFDVPKWVQTDRLRLRPLTIHDAVSDFDAVITSEERLRTVYDPGGDWPSSLTLEQNIIELGWHQTEFQLRTSFAYTVVSLDETEVLGCVYIYPSMKDEYDAEITLWVRQSRVAEGLDLHLFETVESWIAEVWPFKKSAYPGRHISFEDWRR